MAEFYVRIFQPEFPPRYVEKGAGIKGVILTDSFKAAKRYPTREAAEKIADAARKMKEKEPGADHVLVEVCEIKPPPPPEELPPDKDDPGWVTQIQFSWGRDGGTTLAVQICKKDGRDWWRWLDDQGRSRDIVNHWQKCIYLMLARTSEITIGKLIEYEASKKGTKK